MPAASPLAAITHAIRSHLLTDAAFAALGTGGSPRVVRERLPRREHGLPGDVFATIEPGDWRQDRAESTGEDRWVHPISVWFDSRVKDDEDGTILEVLSGLAYEFARDLRDKPPAFLDTADYPTTAKFARVVGVACSPVGSTDAPATNRVTVRFEVHTHELRE